MTFDLELTDRRALVTGGTKGVGAAVVEALHGAGAEVVATARHVPARARDGVRFVAADLSTAEGASAVAEQVLQELGGIDILVNVHPWLLPDFWQFPTGSMGIGPISSIYHARFMR